MNILNPPKNYIDYRCYIYELSGPELSTAQQKFYKKHSEFKGEILKCFKDLETMRYDKSLPIEKIEIRENDGLKHGRVVAMMIYDIEYLIESGKVKQRKIYFTDQGALQG